MPWRLPFIFLQTNSLWTNVMNVVIYSTCSVGRRQTEQLGLHLSNWQQSSSKIDWLYSLLAQATLYCPTEQVIFFRNIITKKNAFGPPISFQMITMIQLPESQRVEKNINGKTKSNLATVANNFRHCRARIALPSQQLEGWLWHNHVWS